MKVISSQIYFGRVSLQILFHSIQSLQMVSEMSPKHEYHIHFIQNVVLITRIKANCTKISIPLRSFRQDLQN